ncbi:MAG: tetratricopeptide repeat protein [Candidatus Latescibacteria bacterium]|nr:tetratricopeptide repeat protein [Candidatus Latescibacterota bacterium]
MEWLRRYPGWAVVALALGLRLLYLTQISDSPLFRHPVVDAETYADQAAQLAGGNWLGRGEGPYWQPPLYPYFLGVIRAAFPDHFWFVSRLLQVLLGALSCGLTWWLGRRFFGPGVGLAAGLAAAGYGPLIYHDGELLPATLGICLNLLALVLLVRGGGPRHWVGTGAVLGLASLALAPSLVFTATAAAWCCWQGWQTDRTRALRRAGFLLLGAVLVVAPVSLRNYLVGGDTVLISYNGGVNFYLGNNPQYERTIGIRPGWEWDDLVGQPLAAGIVRPSDKAAFFYTRAWEYIGGHPLDYLGLLTRKAWSYWQGDEVGRNQDIYFWRRYSVLLSGLLWKAGLAFPFGVVAPLSLLGLGLALRRREPTLLLIYAFAHFAAVTAFFVTSRYRLPALPVLLLFAAEGGRWLWQHRHQRQGGVVLAGLVLLGVGANWGLAPMQMTGDAAIHYNLGQAYAKDRQVAEARSEFAEAVRLDSTYWQAWLNLGSVEAMSGNMPEAAGIFARVAAARPGQVEAWMNLAHARVGLQQLPEAAQAYNEALKLPSPHRRQIYLELIGFHLRTRQFGEAEAVLRQAQQEYPAEAGQFEQAFRQVKARIPGQ